MAEKKLTAYELGQEWTTILSLLNELTNEDGVTRELTDEEKKFFESEVNRICKDIKDKVDSIGKVYKNFMLAADIAKAEKEAIDSEVKRLRKRAQARENEADRVKSLLSFIMDALKEKKVKGNIFSAYYQATQKSTKELTNFDINKIPVEFLKRELSPSAIKAAFDEGRLYHKTEEEDHLAYHTGTLFYKENGVEKKIEGVSYKSGETLVIR